MVTSSKRKRTKLVALDNEDAARLDHVHTFRITSFEALHRLFFKGRSIDAAKAWVYKMRDAGYLLTADKAIGLNAAIYLTRSARQQVYGERVRKPNPYLSENELPVAYGILWYCCLGPSVIDKLDGRRFAETFPELTTPGPADRIDNNLPTDRYYLDDAYSPRRLGYVHVDTGQWAPRIRGRYYGIIKDRYRFQAWRRFIEEDERFAVTILTGDTPTGRKKLDIEKALGPGHPAVPYRVVAVPGLLDLL